MVGFITMLIDGFIFIKYLSLGYDLVVEAQGAQKSLRNLERKWTCNCDSPHYYDISVVGPPEVGPTRLDKKSAETKLWWDSIYMLWLDLFFLSVLDFYPEIPLTIFMTILYTLCSLISSISACKKKNVRYKITLPLTCF